jgi:hypothetical protein
MSASDWTEKLIAHARTWNCYSHHLQSPYQSNTCLGQSPQAICIIFHTAYLRGHHFSPTSHSTIPSRRELNTHQATPTTINTTEITHLHEIQPLLTVSLSPTTNSQYDFPSSWNICSAARHCVPFSNRIHGMRITHASDTIAHTTFCTSYCMCEFSGCLRHPIQLRCNGLALAQIV